jgi:hypothetical protein
MKEKKPLIEKWKEEQTPYPSDYILDIIEQDLEKLFRREMKSIKKKRKAHDDYTRIVAIGNLRSKILGDLK